MKILPCLSRSCLPLKIYDHETQKMDQKHKRNKKREAKLG